MKIKRLSTKLFFIFSLTLLTACSASKEEAAATMAIQTRAARETGTAAVEQAVSNALTQAAPTPTSTATFTPIATATPTFTPTPEFQKYFTEEFDKDLKNWTSFIVDDKGYGGSVLSTLPADEYLEVVNSRLNYNINKTWQYVYSVYKPFEYGDVRIDARFDNRGANNNNISLICRYTEDVGWYEFNIANNGLYSILFAKIKGNGAVSYGLIESGGSNEIKQGINSNEYTGICEGNTLTLYINGVLQRTTKVKDFSLNSGKVGVSVSSFLTLPINVDVDWVKISQIGEDSAIMSAPDSDSLPTATTTPEESSEILPPENSVYPEIFSDTDPAGNAIPMRLVPAGEFTMGSDDDTVEAAQAECLKKYHENRCASANFVASGPLHQVELDAFYMDQYEVTNALYKACVDAHVCDQPTQFDIWPSNEAYYEVPEFDNYPVIFVNWGMASTYCQWRGAHLPTEAEWEKAARGTDGRTYPWGEGIDPSKAHYGVSGTTEVGSYERGVSPYGIYDMVGNVCEWTNDWYAAYPGNTTANSKYGTRFRVTRCGNSNVLGILGLSARSYDIPDSSSTGIGFRCVRSP